MHRTVHGATLPVVFALLLAGCGSNAKHNSSPAVPQASATQVTTVVASSGRPPTSAVAATVAAGTTVTGAAPTSSGVADSCMVITQSEAGAALGHTVRAPVRGRATVEGGVACVFYGPAAPPGADPDVPVVDSARVVLVRGPDAVAFFNDYRGKVPAQPVAGLGDQAYYDGSASLSVLKGDAYLRLAVIGVANVLAAEQKLVAAALPRL